MLTNYKVRDVLINQQTSGVESSDDDKVHFIALRNFVNNFIDSNAKKYGKYVTDNKLNKLLLDVAPQDYEGAQPFLRYSNGNIIVETLDINPKSNATYILDITKYNSIIKDNTYDYILITEVLEHTLQPFDVVKELYRILKPNGIVFLSVPCNFRIHGPLPDNWRFTQYGLQHALFTNTKWEWLECHALENIERNLFPIDYSCVIKKRE